MEKLGFIKKLEYQKELKKFIEVGKLGEEYKGDSNFAMYAVDNIKSVKLGRENFLKLFKSFDDDISFSDRMLGLLMHNFELEEILKDKEMLEKFSRMDKNVITRNVLDFVANFENITVNKNKAFLMKNFQQFAEKCKDMDLLHKGLRIFGYHNIKFMPDAIKGDDEFIRSLLEKNACILRCVDKKYSMDSDLLKKLLNDLSENYDKSRIIFPAYYRQVATIFTLGNEVLKNDRELIKKYGMFPLASEELRNDKQFFMEYCEDKSQIPFFYAGYKLRNDPEVALYAISHNARDILFAGPEVLLNKKIVDYALSRVVNSYDKSEILQAVAEADIKYGKLSEKERLALYEEENVKSEEKHNERIADKKEKEYNADFEEERKYDENYTERDYEDYNDYD